MSWVQLVLDASCTSTQRGDLRFHFTNRISKQAKTSWFEPRARMRASLKDGMRGTRSSRGRLYKGVPKLRHGFDNLGLR